MSTPRPLMCEFASVNDAVVWARDWGGWIADCEDGKIVWFDAAVYTLTPICKYVANVHGGGKVGTWPLFDPTHPCHSLLKQEIPI